MINELADLYTEELNDLMYKAAHTIETLSKKAREPKQGEWLSTGADFDGVYYYQCSECGAEVCTDMRGVAYPHCPYCLAKMKGADDNLLETSNSSEKPNNCDTCSHNGKWENEYEYGYPSPCTGCAQRAPSHYEPKDEPQTERPCDNCQEWDCYGCDYKQIEREDE